MWAWVRIRVMRFEQKTVKRGEIWVCLISIWDHDV